MNFILIQGGGDLASGVALRLHRAGFRVIITELKQPLSVRRAVSFSEAIYEGQHTIEGLTAQRVDSFSQAKISLERGEIPVLIDPTLSAFALFKKKSLPRPANAPQAILDARLLKIEQSPARLKDLPFTIGLGPGFSVGVNCHAAIETNRGHSLGRVLWNGSPNADTRQPEGDPRRVLRAPADGIFVGYAQIGDAVSTDQILARVGDEPIFSPFPGVLRGLIRPGLPVSRGLKIGDVDPRGVRDYCFLVSDKALAIGGAVLEALLSNGIQPEHKPAR